jgi:anaerobic ribonucleoside-triphosphate reductase activating protein
MEIRLAGIVPESIVDGPGYRFAVFAQGCPHKCRNCHNPHTHDFDGGALHLIADIAESVKKYQLTDGVTFTGGEPFRQPEAFLHLAKALRDYNIYCFTGYDFEELLNMENPAVSELLQHIDVLIDGRFDETQTSHELKFKGSKNQRILNCKESIKQGKAVVLIEENN